MIIIESHVEELWKKNWTLLAWICGGIFISLEVYK